MKYLRNLSFRMLLVLGCNLIDFCTSQNFFPFGFVSFWAIKEFPYSQQKNIMTDEPMVGMSSYDIEDAACGTHCQHAQTCLILSRLLSSC
jgi:hypothetical protein